MWRSLPKFPQRSPSIAANSRHETGPRKPAALSSRPTIVTVNFSSAEQTATLELSRKYDMTMVKLVTQMKEGALAARAKAKKEADAAQAAKLSDAPLHALAGNSKPVPLPENAEEVEFDGTNGRLDFYSPSTVRALAAFYRDALKAEGWKERLRSSTTPTWSGWSFPPATSR